MKIRFITFCLLLLTSCQSVKIISGRKQIKKHLDKAFFNNHFTGLAVYDPSSKEWLYTKNTARYFTPASNVKLLSLYAGIKLLGDSLPGLKYQYKGDTLLFQGTGDPTFLHPDFNKQPTYDFLNGHKGSLKFIPTPISSKPYGPGWSWDDYHYDFQPERNDFPIYGNVVRTSSNKGMISAIPDIFTEALVQSNSTSQEVRYADHNIFVVNPLHPEGRVIPFRTYPELTTTLLIDTLHKKVSIDEVPFKGRVKYSQTSRDLYSILMKRSDNFYAEQLLMMCSSTFSDTLSVEKTIGYISRKYLTDLPDTPAWVDGSGLSRYNLITPRSVVTLLDKLREEKSDEWLFSVLPVGGQSGTIKRWYSGVDSPYVYAKTGTLRNNHNLSGYLITNSGKTLIFSFMNNNYTTTVSNVKMEMEKVLELIRNTF